MQELTVLIAQYGLMLVFLNVLLDELGFPIPAVPALVVAGALAAAGRLSAWEVCAVAMLSALIADLIWFAAGRRFGHRVLKTLCRISLSPDSCVRQTESFYERWGVGMLLFSKFIPGLSTIAPPLAGAMRLSLASFLVFNSIGVLIWAGLSIGAGYVFHAQVEHGLRVLEQMGTATFYLVGALFAAFIAIKWWERRRFYKTLRMARISVDELQHLMHRGERPVVLDVRSEAARKIDARKIPGAHSVDMAEPDKKLAHVPEGAEIIVYCTCPDEASAARVAQLLMDKGFKRVRPLAGGLDAWFDAGYAGEAEPSPAP